MVLFLEYVKAWGVHGKEYIGRGMKLSPTVEASFSTLPRFPDELTSTCPTLFMATKPT